MQISTFLEAFDEKSTTIRQDFSSFGMRAVVAIAVIAASTSAGAGTNYKVIHNFTGSAASGSFPVGNLVADAAGNFYWVSVSASTDTSGFCYDEYQGCGAIFKLYPTASGGWAATNLHSFTGGLDAPLHKAAW